ncbi:MAG: DUF3727 domain-containing protein [Coleofasciculaceae cyanobacterium SM2_1_6]|nr:DUF3727 domain-containing protein [Coleofasciculaceae cyanobacterium SM2_1_6]
MFSSQFSEDNGQSQNQVITLKDEAGRSLDCFIEQELDIDGSEYALLLPVDHPIEIFVWEDDGEFSDPVFLEEEEIDVIFADAQAVLAEQNLVLKRSAFTLSVAGELPPVNEEELLIIEMEDDDISLEPEEYQPLATFYHEEEEYSIYTPRDPLLLFAKRNAHGALELVPPEEVQSLQPFLEDMLFSEDE